MSQKKMKENRFYVYAHLNPSTGQPFYIGRGTGNRMYSTVHRSEYWHNTVNKYGIEYKKIADGLTNEEANRLEKETIALYGRKEHGGILVNLTDGGDGLCGYKPNEETLIKKSKAIKGRIFKQLDRQAIANDLLQGSTINEIAAKNNVTKTTVRKQIDESLRKEARNRQLHGGIYLKPFPKGNKPWNYGISVFNGESNPFSGKKHNKESKKAMAEAKNKQVLCINTGITYPSTVIAAQATGLLQSSIAKVARGYQKQVSGYIFKYV